MMTSVMMARSSRERCSSRWQDLLAALLRSFDAPPWVLQCSGEVRWGI